MKVNVIVLIITYNGNVQIVCVFFGNIYLMGSHKKTTLTVKQSVFDWHGCMSVHMYNPNEWRRRRRGKKTVSKHEWTG